MILKYFVLISTILYIVNACPQDAQGVTCIIGTGPGGSSLSAISLDDWTLYGRTSRGSISLEATVPSSIVIGDINLLFSGYDSNIDSDFVSLALTSPGGQTSVILRNSDYPNPTPDFQATIFDAEGNATLKPPFTGHLKPASGDFEIFKGKDAKGLWKLLVRVQRPSRISYKINAFELHITPKGCSTCGCGKTSLFEHDHKCVVDCPTDTYADLQQRKCISCSSTCSTCTGPTIYDCKSCPSGRHFVPKYSACVDSCPDATYLDVASNICKSCHTSCSTCTDGTVCTKCGDGYVSQADKSCIACDPGCNDCSAINMATSCVSSCICNGNGNCQTVASQKRCYCSGYKRGPSCDYEPPSHYCSGVTDGKPCLNGIEMLGAGFDVLRGEKKASAVKRLDFVGLLYQNYQIPRQVSVISNKRSEDLWQSNTVASLKEYSSYRSEKTGSNIYIGIQNKDIAVEKAFAHSAEANLVRRELKGSKSTVTIMRKVRSTAKASLRPDTYFTENEPDFDLVINLLPSSYDRERYTDVIKQFGSHYIREVTLGGEAKSIIKDQFCAKQLLSKFDYDSRYTAEFEGSRGIGTKYGGGSYQHAQTKQASSSKSSISYFKLETVSRTDTPPVPSSGWKEWDHKILQSPWPIEYQLSPISKAIKDPAKRANMLKALQSFFEMATTPGKETTEKENASNIDDETCENARKDIEQDIDDVATISAITRPIHVLYSSCLVLLVAILC